MGERTYVLTVREVPRSVNAGGGGSRTNPYVAHREKKKWEGRYLMELLAERVPRGMTFCNIEIVVHWKHANRRDEPNWYQPITKPLLDAMVQGGYLPDDTPGFVKVTDLRFDHPAEWPFSDPRIKGYMTIKLEASYP